MLDFLVETKDVAETIQDPSNTLPSEEPLRTWKVFVNEVSCAGQCGAGVLVVSLEGVEIQFALRFSFDITNNEA